MNTLKHLLFFLLLIVIFSCQNKKDEIKNYKFIDIDNILLEEKIYFSSIFIKVKAIPLETKELCMIGQINQIEFLNNEIFILDIGISKSLFVFNNEGRFLRKIGTRGKGPGEYFHISSFSIDKNKGVIFTLDPSLHKVIQYSLNGSFISEFKIDPKSRPSQLIVRENSIYIDHQPTFQKKTENLLKVFNYKGELINDFFQFPDYNKGFQSPLSTGSVFSIAKNDIKYYKPFSDTIFSITKDGLMPNIVFHKERPITKKEMEDINAGVGPKAGYFGYRGFKGVSNYYECDNLIMFIFLNEYTNNYLYWPKSNTRKVVNMLVDDMSYLKQPIRFIASYKNQFITHIQNESIVSFVEFVKTDSIKLSTDEIQEIEKLTMDSNPVLLFYECRENIIED